MGLMNDVFGPLAPALVELFVDTKRVFRRREVVYDPTDGSAVPTDTNASFLSGPPTPFSKGELGKNFGGTDNNIKAGDNAMIVATAHYEAENFDIEPTSNAQVFVTVEGQEYMILGVNPFDAGDGNVAIRLHLRR